MEEMTDKERADFLIQWLSSLYRIQATEPNSESVKKEITFVEVRLSQLGFNDFSKLK